MNVAKALPLSLSLGLATLGAFSSSASADPQTPAGVDPALAAAQAFVTALENADIDALVATFAEDATVFLPFASDPARLAGKAQIRAAFDAFLKDVRTSVTGPPYLQLEPRDVHVQHFDGMAVVTFHLGTLATPAGDTPARFARRTAVLRQVGDTWRIVHLHASNMEPVEKPSQ
jgi:uncharacterized protein (TIGR02246 family)